MIQTWGFEPVIIIIIIGSTVVHSKDFIYLMILILIRTQEDEF